jgi:hydroxysqualene synthase
MGMQKKLMLKALPPISTINAPKSGLPLRRAQWHCLRSALSHYENFLVLGPLTPLRLVPHLSALYAFCRHSDDLADEIQDPATALLALDKWTEELQRSLEGHPGHPITRALSWTTARYELPSALCFDLLSAFRQDLTVHRFANFTELRDYTRRSADPVGRLVLRLYGYAEADLDALSDSICTGLQLANFCQDVSSDARRDRLYIPLDECMQFGVDPDDILHGNFTPALDRLLRYQIVRAYKFLNAGASLPEKLPGKLGLSVRLFLLGGLAILDQVQRDPPAALSQRVTLNSFQKLGTVIRSFRPIPARTDSSTGARG